MMSQHKNGFSARRTVTIVAGVAAVALGVASDCRAVVLYRSATRNTTAPTGTFANSGWQLQGQFGSFLGTPIAPQYFITAQHLGGSPTNTIVYNGTTYPIDTNFAGSGPGWVNDPSTDLRIWKIQGTFPTHAQLFNPAVDGSEVGRVMTVFGRGTARGNPVYSRFATPPRDGSDPNQGSKLGELKGWEWGASDSVQAWGTNVVTGAFNAGSGLGDVVYFDFDRNGLFDEAGLSSGDSGGGVFIQSGGSWKLAAINLAVDGPWRTAVDRPAFNATIFDAGGLYVNDVPQLIPEASADVPAAAYSTQISPRLSWIQSITGVGASEVPEPSSAALAIVATVFAGARRRRPKCVPARTSN